MLFSTNLEKKYIKIQVKHIISLQDTVNNQAVSDVKH